MAQPSSSILLLLLIVAVTTALPQNNNDQVVAAASNNETDAVVGTFRQGRADLTTSLSRLLTPNNIAQVKGLFSGLGSYGSTGLGSVLSLNVSNLILITLLAGLAVLIAPAVLSLFGLGNAAAIFGRHLGAASSSSSSDHVARTEQVYRALDGFFRNYNIDAKTCMQRFACTASRSSSMAVRLGNPSYVDSALNYLLNSTYVASWLDNTSMMDAIEFGRSGGDCEIEYGKCPFSWDKVTQYIPFMGSSSTTSQPPQAPVPVLNVPVRN